HAAKTHGEPHDPRKSTDIRKNAEEPGASKDLTVGGVARDGEHGNQRDKCERKEVPWCEGQHHAGRSSNDGEKHHKPPFCFARVFFVVSFDCLAPLSDHNSPSNVT